jgi:tetraacyldisaccharide 4'-kinase
VAKVAEQAIANAILKITNRVPGITRTLLLYRLIQLLTLPLAAVYFGFRLFTNRNYRPHFTERLGFLPRCLKSTKHDSIWLHAVSLGEIASAAPLLSKLHADQPQVEIYVSTSTVAGRKAAERQLAFLANGIFYAPLDYIFCVRRVLRAIHPALVIVLETEIWPHLYAEVKKTGASLAVVNARISNRTWPRYQAAKGFFAPILALLDLVLAQSPEDSSRYLQLGVASERLAVVGNLKYDAAANHKPSNLPTFGSQHVWIAASTVGPNERGSNRRHSIDEDDIVLDAFCSLINEFTDLLLILAPRQPVRFDKVAEKLQRRNLSFLRRSQQKEDPALHLELPGVLLLDTIGDLGRAFSLAHVAFVGGSIAPRGGHNILEPAAAGVPIIVGPHTQNFAPLVRDFLAANALLRIELAEDLLPAVGNLLKLRNEANALGRRGADLVKEQRGVSGRVAAYLWPLYHRHSPKARPNRIAHGFLASLAFLWEYGGVHKRRRSEVRVTSQSPLSVPVISVGGITIGGSGKTPFANFLANRLRDKGYSPAILTRGYRRRSPARHLIFAPGATAPPALTGDEAQIFLRSGAAAVGIGSNRYQTAKILLHHHPATDVFLLDDGFQHARLPRDLDIVVIDGLDPFGKDHVVPLGRLREPLSALRRAQVFIVTRAETDLRYEAICRRLQQYNPHAPVFRTRLKVRGWRDYRSGQLLPSLPTRRVGAFCGLGNPQNFWNTLESLGLEVVFRWAFEDHHSYKPAELQRVTHHARVKKADILVTTEKDRMNCPDHLASAIAPLELAWLEIDLEIEEESAFMSFLEERLRRHPAAAGHRALYRDSASSTSS